MPAPIKPAYGTNTVASATQAAGLRLAYLLNGPDTAHLVNSKGGGENLIVYGTGMIPDTGSGAMNFTGSGFVQIPNAPLTEFNGIAAASIMLSFRSPSALVPLWAMGNAPYPAASFIPFNDHRIYDYALLNGGNWYNFDASAYDFSKYHQLAVTGTGGGTIRFYIDGGLVHSQAADGTVSLGASGHLGHNVGGYQLTGDIGYFYAWKRELKAADVAELYADPYKPIFSPGISGPFGTDRALWLGGMGGGVS